MLKAQPSSSCGRTLTNRCLQLVCVFMWAVRSLSALTVISLLTGFIQDFLFSDNCAHCSTTKSTNSTKLTSTLSHANLLEASGEQDQPRLHPPYRWLLQQNSEKRPNPAWEILRIPRVKSLNLPVLDPTYRASCKGIAIAAHAIVTDLTDTTVKIWFSF